MIASQLTTTGQFAIASGQVFIAGKAYLSTTEWLISLAVESGQSGNDPNVIHRAG